MLQHLKEYIYIYIYIYINERSRVLLGNLANHFSKVYIYITIGGTAWEVPLIGQGQHNHNT